MRFPTTCETPTYSLLAVGAECLHFDVLVDEVGTLKTLIDTGAGVNLINDTKARRTSRQPKLLNERLVLEDVQRNTMVASQSLQLTLKLGNGDTLTDDFIVAPIKHDVILGIPFLTNHDAKTDCRKRTIDVSNDSGGRSLIVAEATSETTEDVGIAIVATKQDVFRTWQRMAELDVADKGDYESGISTLTDGRNDEDVWFIGFVTEQQEISKTPFQRQLDVMVENFKDVFEEPKGCPPKRRVEHTIDMISGSKFPEIRYRSRFSEKDENDVNTEIKRLLEAGLIEESVSPFGAQVLFVNKKDGTRRMVVDYRQLNAVTIPDRYPIPNMADQFGRLTTANVFSKMDLHSGFHQVRMKDVDRYKTTFHTPTGAYQWIVMPFGLRNSPSTFQRLMTDVLRDFIFRKFVMVYIDDILVYSKDETEHIKHLSEVLERLRTWKLALKRKKCVFGVTRVEFCGHDITPDGLLRTSDKLIRVRDWPKPKCVKDVRGFLGFTGFYRKFVKRYADITRPLSKLLRKNTPWRWELNTSKHSNV